MIGRKIRKQYKEKDQTRRETDMVKRLLAILMTLTLCCLSISASAEGDSWTCPGCGQEGNTGKFCGNCATARPAVSGAWTCPTCGQEGNTGKFCGNCATARPGASSTAAEQAQPAASENLIIVPGDKDIPILDTATYPGNWKQAYTAILQKHAAGLRAFEEHTIEWDDSKGPHVLACYPAGFADLTGDGTPELLIMDLNTDSGDGELYVYSADQEPARCIFSLPAILQTYDDELQGVNLFMAADGGQSTFVIKYWDYGSIRVLQMNVNTDGVTVLNAWGDHSMDFSGEANGAYTRNEESISWEQLMDDLDKLEARTTQEIGSIPWTSGGNGYGFTYTLQTALDYVK